MRFARIPGLFFLLVGLFLLSGCKPTITAVDPDPAEPGTEITITGSGFGSSQGSVLYDGDSLSISSWSDSVIVATLPTDKPNGTYDLWVMVGIQGAMIQHTIEASSVECRSDADCPPSSGYKWATTCDPDTNTCVECLIDEDCSSDSLGSYCSSKLCACSTNDDCTGNANGFYCDNSSLYTICSCVTDMDCPSGKTCIGDAFGIPVCE